MVIINRILILMILLAVCVGSASAATSEGSAWGVTYWSDIDSNYDYSAMYSIDFAEVTQGYSNVTGYTYVLATSSGSIYVTNYYSAKPTKFLIDFDLYSGLSAISSVTNYTSPSADFGFTTGFSLTGDGGVDVGGGSVSVWENADGFLIYYYTFSDMWNYSYTSTHSGSPEILTVTFDDSTNWDLIGEYVTGGVRPDIQWARPDKNLNLGFRSAVRWYTASYGSGGPQDCYIISDDRYTVLNDVVQNVVYKYNVESELGLVLLNRTVGNNLAVPSRLGIALDTLDDNIEGNNSYSVFTDYNLYNVSYTLSRVDGVLVDIYTTSALDYPTFTFILDNGGGGSSGAFADVVPIGSDPTFEYSVTTDTAVYSPGDTVSVTYTTDRAGSLQVRDAVTDTVVHSKAFSAAVTNATWQFYIPTSDNYGYFDVYLLNTYGGVLDTVRYTLLPESNLTSFLHIVQPSINLFEEMDINVQAANESTFTLKDPNGIIVFNTTISAQTYSGLTYVPTVKTGTYTAYLYDVETLTDTIIVYAAVAPDIIDENATIIEDVMREDETMTEYFDDKFREFAPTAWGIFLLSILLWFMSILVSFGGSGSKRRR